MENGKYGEYAVTFTDANGNSYEVGVTRSAGTLTHIWFYNNGANLGTRTWKSAEITDTLCQSVYKNAKSIVTAMYSDTAIASGTCNCSERAETQSRATCHSMLFWKMDALIISDMLSKTRHLFM